jgi:HlyD family secretion protein
LRKRILITLFFLVLIGVSIFVYLGQRHVKERELYYSGTIEADHAELSFQLNGKVTDILVDEGEKVRKNQLLAILDESEYRALYENAMANMEKSLKNFEKAEKVLMLYKETLPADVMRAEAGLNVLQSQLRELEAGYRQQDIEQARLAVSNAENIMEEAKKDRERHEVLFQKGVISEKQWDRAQLEYQITLKNYEKAKEALDIAEEGARKETIQTARARVSEGKSALKLAKNNLGKIGPAEKEVEMARAQVKAARSLVDLAGIRMSYTKLLAPFQGVITSRNSEVGEVALAGQEVMTLSDLSHVELKIFVDEIEIGKVRPGQEADIKIDTFPDKIYKGRVSFVSPEAEFTPKIIQTHKERVKLVYLVKISIPNPDLELKPGMPADAWLQ